MSFKSYKITPSESVGEDIDPKFNYALFFKSVLFILTVSGLFSWALDPLWLAGGNKITGKNYDFPDERTLKTNLFLNTYESENYDCIIFGSSRVNAIKPSLFEGQKCFNYSFKSGHIEEFLVYSELIQDVGVEPKKIYIGVDDFNFLENFSYDAQQQDISKSSPFEAFFSFNSLVFSVKTLMNLSPDKSTYYDERFELKLNDNPKLYQPDLDQAPLDSFVGCFSDKAELYQDIKKVFPNAQIIGYVPPRSAWRVIEQTYQTGLLDCTLQSFYQISTYYDAFYDFSIPSEITIDPSNTYDGSHFSPVVNDEIIKILQEKEPSFGLNLLMIEFETYSALYSEAINTFLGQESLLNE